MEMPDMYRTMLRRLILMPAHDPGLEGLLTEMSTLWCSMTQEERHALVRSWPEPEPEGR